VVKQKERKTIAAIAKYRQKAKQAASDTVFLHGHGSL
jgi:hypothetical protein